MSEWSGAGLCPAGITPAGYGYQPLGETAKPQAFRMPDGSTGEAAKINAKTGDFELDERGQKLGMTGPQQMVLLALKTMRGSAATDIGIEPFPDRISEQTKRIVEARITNALADLRTRGIIELKSIEIVEPKEGALAITVVWRDVSSGTTERTPI